jgi:hypothetical protein
MKTKAISLVVLGLIVLISGSAGGADPPKPAPVQPATASNSVFFLRDVMPLVTRLGCNSVQCHGAPLMDELKITHQYRDGPKREHLWHSGWLPEAVQMLLEEQENK